MPKYSFRYCDANVFVSFINTIPERIRVIEAFFEEITNSGNHKIVTSVISKVEVAFAKTEQAHRQLSDSELERIDALWNDYNIIELIDFNDDISTIARDLMRAGIDQGWALKPNDAIHLASAKWINATEFNTYDLQLHRYNLLIGIDIHEPIARQGNLYLP